MEEYLIENYYDEIVNLLNEPNDRAYGSLQLDLIHLQQHEVDWFQELMNDVHNELPKWNAALLGAQKAIASKDGGSLSFGYQIKKHEQPASSSPVFAATSSNSVNPPQMKRMPNEDDGLQIIEAFVPHNVGTIKGTRNIINAINQGAQLFKVIDSKIIEQPVTPFEYVRQNNSSCNSKRSDGQKKPQIKRTRTQIGSSDQDDEYSESDEEMPDNGPVYPDDAIQFEDEPDNVETFEEEIQGESTDMFAETLQSDNDEPKQSNPNASTSSTIRNTQSTKLKKSRNEYMANYMAKKRAREREEMSEEQKTEKKEQKRNENQKYVNQNRKEVNKNAKGRMKKRRANMTDAQRNDEREKNKKRNAKKRKNHE